MLEEHRKMGAHFYKEYPNTIWGKIRAIIKYKLLPPCDRSATLVDDAILIGSFDGARVVRLEAFYSDHLPNQGKKARVGALDEIFEKPV